MKNAHEVSTLLRNQLENYRPGLLKKGYFRAAVVVPLIDHEGEAAVLFQVRSAQLAWQPGDICFPGGRIEAAETPAQAARREVVEELGVGAEQLELLGELPEVASPIGVWLHPYVGRLLCPQQLRPQQAEVAELFSVPLAALLATQPVVGKMELATKPLPGFPYHLLPSYSRDWRRRGEYEVYFYPWQDRLIWGLTAQVLKSFLDLCRQALPEQDWGILGSQ